MQYAHGILVKPFMPFVEMFQADWFHTLLRFAVQGISSSLRGWETASSLGWRSEQASGIDVWDYLSGKNDRTTGFICAKAVDSQTVHPNPDTGCPYVARLSNGKTAWMPCNNNGSRPLPPFNPPKPKNGHQLQYTDSSGKSMCLGTKATTISKCTAETSVWEQDDKDGHLLTGTEILKIFESDAKSMVN